MLLETQFLIRSQGAKTVCGICGYIGDSKDPDATYELITRLFEKTEMRGEDAAGCWGVDGLSKGKKVFYHKAPGKSSEFVKKDIWTTRMLELQPNLLICHARAASMGAGLPSINKNNHPFTNFDKTIGLIHNGRIPDVEYRALKKKYKTASNCDSEILLRIFESGKQESDRSKELFGGFDAHIASRLTGLKDIWSYLSLGHMAVAIGERVDEERRSLWLFRNKHRALWLSDMRKTLGQVFFFSVPQIWREAVAECTLIKPYLSGGVKLVELPTEEIWLFNTGPDMPLSRRDSLKRFEVCSSGNYESWKDDGKEFPILKASESKHKSIEIITDLDDQDDVINEDDDGYPIGYYTGDNQTTKTKSGTQSNTNHTTKLLAKPNIITKKSTATTVPTSHCHPLSDVDATINIDSDNDEIEQLCGSISETSESIKTVFNNQLLEGSMNFSGFQDLKTALEQTDLDMQGTLRILDR